MRQEVECEKLFHISGIEDELLQKSGVGFDRGHSRLETRRSTEQGGHLHSFHGCFQLVPGLTVMKPLPEIVTVREIREGAIERLLPTTDTSFDLAKNRSGRDVDATIEQIASVPTRHLCCFIPWMDCDPETLTVLERNQVPFPTFPGSHERYNS